MRCSHCEKRFSPKNSQQKYCSQRCKKRAGQKRFSAAHSERLKEKSRNYYNENKDQWRDYNATQEAKREADPELAARFKQDARKRERRYIKNNPGVKALKREQMKDKKIGTDRKKRVRSFGPVALMAASRLCAAESKLSEPFNKEAPDFFTKESWILQQAATILLVRAGSKILNDHEKEREAK